MSSPCSDGDSPPLSPSSPSSSGSSRRRKGVLDTRRAEQNRAAQRAFRQRKERYVKELETKVRDLQEIQSRANKLEEENEHLRQRIWELEHQQGGGEGIRGPSSHPNLQPPTQRATSATATASHQSQSQQNPPPLSPPSPPPAPTSSHYQHHHHPSSLPTIASSSQTALPRTLPLPPTFSSTREMGPMRLSDNRHPLPISDHPSPAQGTVTRSDPPLPGAENGRVLDDLITILRTHHRPPIPTQINEPSVES